jgi:hypothetical protein
MLGVVKSVESLTFNATAGNLYVDVTLTKGQNVDNCVRDAQYWKLDVHFVSSDTLRIERADSTDQTTGYVHIVEFDPNTVRVQQDSFIIPKGAAGPQEDSQTLASTIVTANTGMTVYARLGNVTDGSDWNSHSVRYDKTTTTFDWRRAEGSDLALYGHYYIFESLNGAFSTQSIRIDLGGGDTSDTGAINAVNLSKSFLVPSGQYSIHNDADLGLTTLYIKFVDTTTISIERTDAGNYVQVQVQVIEFNDDTTVQYGDMAFGAGDATKDVTVTAVDLDYSIPVLAGTYSATKSDGLAAADYNRSFIYTAFTSTTNLRGTRFSSGVARTWRYQVVDFAHAPTYTFAGTVTEESTPVVRTVRAYDRDSGELVGETTSSGAGGSYSLETTSSGTQYLVCLDDLAGTSYNLLGYDLVIPTTVSG